MTVYKGIKVSNSVDLVITNLSGVCAYYKIRMNGGTEINASSLLRCVFDNLMAAPEKDKYLHTIIRDVFRLTQHGDPISEEMIKEITNKALNNVR